MIKVYPSAATFTLGRENTADFPSQCHRLIWLAAHGVRKPDDASAESKAAGSSFEDTVERWLGAEFGEGSLVKEKGLTLYDEESGWVANGRCDFVVTLEDGSRLPAECKATRSSSTAADFRAGRIKLYHLAQLLIYMATLQSPRGRLYCGVFNKKGEVSYHRFYDITLDEAGQIFVDGAPFAYNIQDLFNGFDVVADHYFSNTVPDRPTHYNNVWKSPCLKCPFGETCEIYEDTGSISAFIEASAKLSPKRKEEE